MSIVGVCDIALNFHVAVHSSISWFHISVKAPWTHPVQVTFAYRMQTHPLNTSKRGEYESARDRGEHKKV